MIAAAFAISTTLAIIFLLIDHHKNNQPDEIARKFYAGQWHTKDQ